MLVFHMCPGGPELLTLLTCFDVILLLRCHSFRIDVFVLDHFRLELGQIVSFGCNRRQTCITENRLYLSKTDLFQYRLYTRSQEVHFS